MINSESVIVRRQQQPAPADIYDALYFADLISIEICRAKSLED